MKFAFPAHLLVGHITKPSPTKSSMLVKTEFVLSDPQKLWNIRFKLEFKIGVPIPLVR